MSMTAPVAPGDVRAGRYGPVLAGVWLFFLIDPVLAGVREDNHVRGWAGVLAIVAFAAVYMSLWIRARVRLRRFGDLDAGTIAGSVARLGLLIALATAIMVLLGEPGIASTVYLAVAVVMLFRPRYAAPLVVLIAVGTVLLGLLPGWEFEFGTAFGVLAAAAAVAGLRAVIRRNTALLEAHETNAALAVESERSRFARDLHDILGHSLTVITIKAELAGRLFDADPERARAELADLERLSRDALTDVRRAVEGYRDLSLPGELARARTALSAAQIAATLPGSTDDVPGPVRELFAWTIREAVTNVIRHSGAHHCEVRLSATSVEVCDDGRGMLADAVRGSGLVGLQERAAAIGATLVTRSLDPGWSVEVVVP